MSDENIKTEHFDCVCFTPQHTLRFILVDFEDGFPPTLETEVCVTHFHPWWKRVWVAAKYILGFGYPDFDGFMMHNDDVPRLKRVLEEYERRWKEFQERKTSSK